MMKKGTKRGNFLNDLPEMQSLQANKKTQKGHNGQAISAGGNNQGVSENDFPDFTLPGNGMSQPSLFD